MSDGKSFEAELAGAAKLLRAYDHSSNSTLPACDRVMGIPIAFRGWVPGPDPTTNFVVRKTSLFCLCECKENASSDRFDFAEISKAERRHLERATSALGLAYIFIKHIRGHVVRYWALTWNQWLELEEQFGFVPFPKPGERRKPGTASFPLGDNRPPTLLELHRVAGLTMHSRHALDLTPILPEWMVPV